MRHATFRDTYAEARTLFIDSVEAAGGVRFSFAFDHATGPGDLPLSIDAARFGPQDAENVLLCVSGTHGAEGFPGSAVQSDWIQSHGADRSGASGNSAVWMVHAVNPYGFAWQMRGNEDHIDLNRNWVNFKEGAPDNPEFDGLVDLLKGYSGAPEDQSQVGKGLFALGAEKGAAWLESVLTRGQYAHPNHMHYGGKGQAASRRVLSELVQSKMPSARRVAYVDFHSGTPGLAELIFLCFSPPQSEAFARASSWWGREHLDPATVEAKWGGQRPMRHGLMYWGLEEVFGADVEFAGAVVEFGTVEKDERMRPLMASLLEAWIRREGVANVPDVEQHLEFLRWCFDRPGDADWERTVLERGAWVLRRALIGLEAWATEGR